MHAPSSRINSTISAVFSKQRQPSQGPRGRGDSDSKVRKKAASEKSGAISGKKVASMSISRYLACCRHAPLSPTLLSLTIKTHFHTNARLVVCFCYSTKNLSRPRNSRDFYLRSLGQSRRGKRQLQLRDSRRLVAVQWFDLKYRSRPISQMRHRGSGIQHSQRGTTCKT